MSLVKILCATAIAASLLSFTTPGVADPGLLKIYQRNLAHQKLPKTKAALPAKDFNGSTIEDSKRHRKKMLGAVGRFMDAQRQKVRDPQF